MYIVIPYANILAKEKDFDPYGSVYRLAEHIDIRADEFIKLVTPYSKKEIKSNLSLILLKEETKQECIDMLNSIYIKNCLLK